MLTRWRPGVVDFAVCLPRVQLFVRTCDERLHLALPHHWLLPINCHFDDCKARLVMFPCKTRYIRIPGFSFKLYALRGSRIRAFDWYQNQWPWMTLNDVTTADLRYLCCSWASCWKFVTCIWWHRKAIHISNFKRIFSSKSKTVVLNFITVKFYCTSPVKHYCTTSPFTCRLNLPYLTFLIILIIEQSSHPCIKMFITLLGIKLLV